MNIKVCGITQVKQLQQLEALNIGFAGLIFYPGSPRNVTGKIEGKALKGADFELKKTGVFVNPEMIDVLDAIDEFGLDVVQLHGAESVEMCEDLSEEVEVIKVFRIGDANDDIDAMVADYDAVCDYYLFDTAGENPGGNGTKFDWKILSDARIEKPFFLSGGISLGDVEAIKKFKHPDFFGVDINSHFEKEPGVKDMAKLLQFTTAFRKK